MNLRKVMPKAIMLMFVLLVSGYGIAYSDNVTGSDVSTPALPANAPGIERPFPHDRDKFTFAIIGDKTGGGLQNWPIFDRAIDEISNLCPDFVIMVGDQIQGYTDDKEQLIQEWKEFYQHASRIQVPFFPLPGNHDISNNTMYEYWNANFGRTYYSFDYKNCHFILLNTEEGRKKGETALGTEQMEWIHEDINEHRNSKHLFLFMHRPVWYESYEASGELTQWKTIESWLGGLPHTIFAGHFHQLTYEERDNSPYYVLSATGGELTPSDVISLGEFHHYTMVTVDGDDIHIAVVRPGSVLSHDVATREFQENADKVFTYEKRFPDFTPSDGKGEFLVNLRNTLDKPITAQIKFLVPSEVASDVVPKERYWDDPYLDRLNYESSWMVYPREVKYILQPGEAKEIVFAISYSAKNLLPFPYYSYSISYGDTLMKQSLSELVPVELKDFTLIREWQVAGPFDLGIRERIPVNKDSSLYVPELMKAQEPERDWDINQTYSSGSQIIAWQKAKTNEREWVDLDAIYGGDFVFAYGFSHIYSPKDQLVLADIWADDVTRAFVNGQEAVFFLGYNDWYHPHYFLMPLKKGWNAVLIKNGDTYKAWGFAVRIFDPNSKLRFSSQAPE